MMAYCSGVSSLRHSASVRVTGYGFIVMVNSSNVARASSGRFSGRGSRGVVLGERLLGSSSWGAALGIQLTSYRGPPHSPFAAVGIRFVVNPSLVAKVAYDPGRDCAPITMIAVSPNVVSVHPSVPAHTVGELIGLI